MEIGNLIGFLILIYLYLASGIDIAGLISYLTPYPYNIHLWGCIDLAELIGIISMYLYRRPYP